MQNIPDDAMAVEIPLSSEAATEQCGAHLARTLAPGCVINLCGELGAGKTTLVRGLLRALGHIGTVKSPTYTLVESYATQLPAQTTEKWRLFHWDLYRLTDPEELEYLGLREQCDGDAILLIEWPERGDGLLPQPDIHVSLAYFGTGRIATLTALSPLGTTVLSRW